MRGIFWIVVIVVVLVAAGVVTINRQNGSISIQIDEAKARERAGQVIEKAHQIESDWEHSEQPTRS